MKHLYEVRVMVGDEYHPLGLFDNLDIAIGSVSSTVGPLGPGEHLAEEIVIVEYVANRMKAWDDDPRVVNRRTRRRGEGQDMWFTVVPAPKKGHPLDRGLDSNV